MRGTVTRLLISLGIVGCTAATAQADFLDTFTLHLGYEQSPQSGPGTASGPIFGSISFIATQDGFGNGTDSVIAAYVDYPGLPALDLPPVNLGLADLNRFDSVWVVPPCPGSSLPEPPGCSADMVFSFAIPGGFPVSTPNGPLTLSNFEGELLLSYRGCCLSNIFGYIDFSNADHTIFSPNDILSADFSSTPLPAAPEVQTGGLAFATLAVLFAVRGRRGRFRSHAPPAA